MRNTVHTYRAAWLLTLGFGLAASYLAACGDDTDTGNGETTSGGPGSGGSGAGSSSGGGPTVGVGGFGGNVGCAVGCSNDLKKVVCDGVVTETCSGDQACLNGGCTDDPCGAARAAKSSLGCDYWVVRPDVINAVQGSCFAAFIANTWSIPMHIDVAYKGQPITNADFIQIPQGQGQSLTYTPYDPNVGLPVGEVAAVFLAHDTNTQGLPCPFSAAVDGPIGIQGTGFAEAFHITTDRPVVAYSILPFGGGSAQATSASLLLPTSAWDTNYLAINAFGKTLTFGPGTPSLNVVAAEDNTQVSLLPGVAIVGGGGVAATPANQPVIYTLDQGEYMQISQAEELTGSPIQSDKPIGVWGAASCLSVPVDVQFCDSAHQQIPPVRALGSEYSAVRYRNRSSATGDEDPPWRLVGAVDGTMLTWEPSAPTGAPTSINQGEVAEFDAAGPFVVKSQDANHPFYFAQYMTGSERYGQNEGDPEWVNVVPIDQYLDSYVFFTDPSYSETSLVVTRRRSIATNNFEDVTLDCAGVLTGWQALGDHEFTRIDLVTGNFTDVNGCSNGRHEMTSAAPFGVTVWGWGTLGVTPSTNDVSYAYPAGASIRPINDIVIPPTPK